MKSPPVPRQVCDRSIALSMLDFVLNRAKDWEPPMRPKDIGHGYLKTSECIVREPKSEAQRIVMATFEGFSLDFPA